MAQLVISREGQRGIATVRCCFLVLVATAWRERGEELVSTPEIHYDRVNWP